ncbi:thiamine pyrophosphate-binding protein [Paracandidimonas lactea]|uniref:thiamine pyrophosphate-binding protein n=1 Tax=Paracandidimonas lactea TaxID=2895524 RepID=UPI001F329640|nr:thiamine pyrophosphate-binding protein [Paracandidimonas lactea]
MSTSTPRGAQALVQAILQSGADTVFSLSGNHIMPVYEALREARVDLLHTRHEAAAVHMADAWARLTGKVGIALVTGGPGHANAVSALYTAAMSESPVVLLSGHAPAAMQGWGAFQEMDQVAMARPVTKAAWAVTSANTIADDFARACRIALSGRPGPVHLSLPTDVLEGDAREAKRPDPDAFEPMVTPLPAALAGPLLQRLRRAQRPLVLVGPQGLTGSGRQAVAQLRVQSGIPVIATESPRGVNDPALGAFATVLAEADCVLLAGKRLDFTLGFGRDTVFAQDCAFLQVDADTSEFDRTRQAVGQRLETAHQADLLPALQMLAREAAHGPAPHRAWLARVDACLAYRQPDAQRHAQQGGGTHPTAVCAPIQALLDQHPDAVLVIDGGEFGQWGQACLDARHRITNGAAGAIGAALPMALGAKRARPDAPVIALMGDGTFGFHCAELDTAHRYGLHILCVVGNDARWNAEYQIQLRDYGPGKTYGCELLPSRYDHVAAALGCHGEQVLDAAQLPDALARAMASGRASCLNVMVAGLPAPTLRMA